MRFIDAPVWVQAGRCMKWVRKERSYSQEYVAQKSGVNLKRYKRMERGLVLDITIVEAMKIADVFHSDYEEIIPILVIR